jgi:hypothetical protein
VVEQRGKRRVMVHLVNYKAKQSVALDPVPVVCQLPKGESAKEVRIYSPDAEAPVAVAMKSNGSQVRFTVP